MVLNTFAADGPDRPCMFFISARKRRMADAAGGSRTNCVYCGRTLARGDLLRSSQQCHEPHRCLFETPDAVVQVISDSEIGSAQQKMLEVFKARATSHRNTPECPTDGALREGVLGR
jgi:hypothetical protein